MLKRKIVVSWLVFGALPFTSLAVTACSATSTADVDSSLSQPSDMAQMDHGSMDHSSMMNMDLGSKDDSFDLRFIDAMIPHHEGALVMAEQVLERSDRPELKTLAQNIIASQQAEIGQMQQWRQDWYGQ
jgi:uncharacterized protein (DUF305 family)